jgi:hypothetical protein
MATTMSKIEIATDRDKDFELVDELTWLTTKEAARYLRKSVNAIWLLASRGYIRPRKFKRRLYFRRIELDRLLESSPNF